MARTEEPHLKLERQRVVLLGQVGGADQRWSDEGLTERVLVSD